MMMNLISPLEVDKQDCWFLQNGATAHTVNPAMQLLFEFCGGHGISQYLWPP
jgi:hypothetical protein